MLITVQFYINALMSELENRNRLYHLLEADITDAQELHQRTGIPLSTVYSIRSRFFSGEPCERRNGSGRLPLLDTNDRRRVAQFARWHPKWSASRIGAAAEEKGTPHVSARTIQRTLHDIGYVKLVPKTVPFLTAAHKQARCDWCRQFLEDDMRDVFFTDESAFQFYRVTLKQWTKDGRPSAPVPKFSPKLNIWGGISMRGTTTLDIRKENINAQIYTQILMENLLPAAKDLYRRGWRLQQDNAPPHRARTTKDFFEEQRVTVIPWPSNSPDINPIENVWRLMKDELELAELQSLPNWEGKIVETWNGIRGETRRRLIHGLRKRFEEVIAHDGDKIDY